MKKLKIIFGSYNPNSAMTNRFLALLRGIIDDGVKVQIVFVHPNANFDKLEEIPNNVSVAYLWEGHAWRNQIIRRLYGFLDIYKYNKQLKSGDNILLMGSGQFLPILVKRNDIRIFHERTEHPSVVRVIPHFMQGKYLKACKKLDGMFVISTALKSFYESLGVCNVKIINMVVDSTRFEKLNKQNTNEKNIVYCGKATNNKDGVDELIKSFSIVNRKYPDTKLLIVGKAPKAMDESGNIELVRDLGLTEKVIFTGIKSSQEIPQTLKDATMVVLDRPDSLQAQCGFPTKLGEYLLSESPVVVTKVGDIPLFLEDKKSALLAEERNPEEFAKKMIWILEHPTEAEEIGKNGAKVALREFNCDIEAKKIIDLIFNKT